MLTIATAGWSIPAPLRSHFPAEGMGLERYSAVLNGVEINTTFSKRHRPTTYERWAAAVGSGFSFSVKLPKDITHVRGLQDCRIQVEEFIADITALGSRCAVLLVQLPASLAFDRSIAAAFFDHLVHHTQSSVVCEPRHPSWASAEAGDLFKAYGVSRVAADPSRIPGDDRPNGATGDVSYYRLHGSPRTYYSAYETAYLERLATTLNASLSRSTWCVFDNTASGAAMANALQLIGLSQPT